MADEFDDGEPALNEANFYFDLYTGICRDKGVETRSVDTHRWYRTELIDEDGVYEPYYTYRFHDAYEECQAVDWGGRCSPRNCDADPKDVDMECEDWGEHVLYEQDEEHHRKPDLIVDPREFAEDAKIECAYDDEDAHDAHEAPDHVSLRFGMSTANVGTGDLRVESLRPGDDCDADADCPLGHSCDQGECVGRGCDPSDDDCPDALECKEDAEQCEREESCEDTYDCDDPDHRCMDGFCTPTIQHIEHSDGDPPKRVDLSVPLTHNDGHGHTHLDDLWELTLLEKTESCKRDGGTGCEIAGSKKLSYCLRNSNEFDEEIIQSFHASGGLDFDCGSDTVQGISPGFYDSYKWSLEGQLIEIEVGDELDSIEGEQVLLEGEINPDRELEERTFANNRTVVSVEIPELYDEGEADWESFCEEKLACYEYAAPDRCVDYED